MSAVETRPIPARQLAWWRAGGVRFYRASVPFFLGLIAGDLFGGGFFTAIGCFTHINVYPVNW